MKYVVGVDPGLTGALAFLYGNEFYRVVDIPVMGNGKGSAKVKNQVNGAALANIFQTIGLPLSEITVYLEAVAAMPQQGVSSVFSFGDTFGCIRGVVQALGLSMTLVRPTVWKKYHGLIGAPDDAARTKAQLLYPAAPLELKKHHNRAEALLIARYGAMQP